MSVYNRKMFKPRNARNALNRSAGIAPVQRFQQGGSVQPNIFQRFMNAPNTFSGIANALRGTTVPTTNPARQPNTQFTLTPGVAAGVAKDIQPDALRRAEVERLRPFPTLGQALSVKGGISGLVDQSTPQTEADRIAQLTKTGAGQAADVGLQTVAAPFNVGFDIGAGLAASADQITPEFAREVASGRSQLTPQLIAGINSGLVKVPPVLAKAIDDGAITVPGLDITRVQAKPLPAAVQIMKELPGAQTIRVGEEGAGTKGLPPTREERLEAEYQASVDAADKRENMEGSAEELFQQSVDAADTREDTGAVVDSATGTTSVSTTKEDAPASTDQDAILDSETRRQQSQTDTIEFKTAEEVAEVVNNGTQEEQQSQLKQLMAEFTQNAPQYEGIDKGLAIAKIGFAMAAGKSPDAVQNIAKAMSDGADMLIKDKAKRDAFNRQVNLSALQYGLGEVGKERAQQRLDERTFTDFVNDSDKAITYKGVKYEPGRTIRVSNADYLANGGKLPPELITEKVYTSNQTAINQRLKTTAAAINAAREQRTMSVTDQRAYVKEYTGLVKKASEAETAGTLIESVILNAPNIVGLGPAAKQSTANFLALFQLKAPQGWNDQKLGVQDLKAALQSVVPATLGSTQSANSISNRDVELLIQGFLADGVMSTNGDGTFAFATTTQESFQNSLQNGLRAVRKAQVEALQGMTAIDNQLIELYTPGGRKGTALTEPLRGEGIFAPGGTAKEGVSINSLTKADDGIFDINEDFFG